MTDHGTTAAAATRAATHLIEVTFKGNRREFFTWSFPDPPALHAHVIIDADRGEDLGVVNATGELAAIRKTGTTHGKASPDQLRPALRAATAEDIAKGALLRSDEYNVKQRKRFPKEGKIVVTLAGEEKIVSNDIFREQVTLRGATGEVRVVPLAQLNHELGGEPVVTASDLVTGDDASEFEEEAMIEDDLVEPPRGVETRTYPEASRKPESRKPESRKPESRKPQAMSAPRPQVPQVPQQPQSRQAPQSPQ